MGDNSVKQYSNHGDLAVTPSECPDPENALPLIGVEELLTAVRKNNKVVAIAGVGMLIGFPDFPSSNVVLATASRSAQVEGIPKAPLGSLSLQA